MLKSCLLLKTIYVTWITYWHYNFEYFAGISRLTLPSGAKGFGGTEGFMAPEIMRYNGEEEYTEKVCIFYFLILVSKKGVFHSK